VSELKARRNAEQFRGPSNARRRMGRILVVDVRSAGLRLAERFAPPNRAAPDWASAWEPQVVRRSI
jgi:hypothetical protein